jgi:hypothetical protein
MLDYEGYPMLLVWHLLKKQLFWIKRDGYYPDIQYMINMENIPRTC